MKIIETKLLAELRRGHHPSFRKIFEIYSDPLYRFSLSYLKSKEAAEDVVQEVFMKIWNNRQEIKSNTSFHNYLFTIALNSVRKHFNNLSRLIELKHDILADLSNLKEEFDERNDYQELMDKLNELISRMPEKRRQVFVKKKLEEKSLKEIAEELGIEPKTVEYHITQAMKFLKQEFEKIRIKGLIFFHLFLRGKSQ